MAGKLIRIKHWTSGTTLAEGPRGWGITLFEGNLYIARNHLRTKAFKLNWIPGLCSYKFLYVWLDLDLGKDGKVRNLGWMYWLRNPLLPFIWYRVALPANHLDLIVEYRENTHS